MTSMAPPNAYKPGTSLTVGSHKVVITNYLSQGGFAHVYTCTISPPWNDQTNVCLKRVAVPDKPNLNILRQEVDAMRRLEGKSHVVSYIDSHASRMTTGPGYEVFMLMEYCSGNGLIDFMNTRLVNKLTEPEILQIMGEVTEGVAHMHALQPPLIHRDIKIENVLISGDRHYKLCDFGSASPPLRPPRNVEEFQVLQDDIMKHTTPQYRCPEMLDLYRRQPIDEKSDIWALGVFLYKLCYYTTPFEKNAINGNGNAGGGEYAILHGLYSFPSVPPYSSRLKNIIMKLLVVNPQARPNVFQLLEELCKIRGVPFPQIYPASKLQAFMKPQSQLPFNNTPLQQQAPAIPQKPKLTAAPPLPARRDKTTGDIKQAIKTTRSTENLHKSKSARALEASAQEIAEADPFSGIYNSPDVGKSSPELNKKSFIPVSKFNPTDAPKVRVKPKKPRPVSMSATELMKDGGRASPMDNIITSMTKEEVVELSPNQHNSIRSSMDFLRNLSRQNTNNSINGEKTGDSIKRRFGRSSSNTHHNKRSSISSLKDLLTGGRSRETSRQPSYANANRSSSRTSSYSNRNASSDSLLEFAAINRQGEYTPTKQSSNLEFIEDLSSPETIKMGSSPPESKTPVVPPTRPPTRSNSIQRRVHALLNRNISPPPTKTAHGYGKYTDTTENSNNKVKAKSMPPPQFNKVNKIPINYLSTSSASVSYRSYTPTSSLSPVSSEDSPNSFSNGAGSNLLTPKHTSNFTPAANIFKTPSNNSSSVASTPSSVVIKKKKKPVIPPKKSHLRSPAVHGGRFHERKTSDVSTNSLYSEDLDELTEEFNKRFPSRV